MRFKISLLIACLILIASNVLFVGYLINSKKDVKRLENSFSIANSSTKYYKGLNGKMATKVEILELKHTELKKIFSQIHTEIENLKIKSKRVNQYSETVIHQNKEIIRELRDSLIYDTIKVKAFDYQDDYYKVTGNITPDTIRMNIHSSDSLIQVVYRGQRRNPKRWIFSRRQLEQVVSCKNPNSSIQYTRFIQIEK
jgi:hypothetical protein